MVLNFYVSAIVGLQLTESLPHQTTASVSDAETKRLNYVGINYSYVL